MSKKQPSEYLQWLHWQPSNNTDSINKLKQELYIHCYEKNKYPIPGDITVITVLTKNKVWYNVNKLAVSIQYKMPKLQDLQNNKVTY